MLTPLELEDLKELEEMEETEKERFKITDLSTSSWAIRKLKALKKKEEEINEFEKEEIQRIKSWKESQVKEIQNSRDFINTLLREYYEEKKKEDKKFKLSTPYGTFYTKSNNDKLIISKDKEEDLIKLFEEIGSEGLIKTQKSIDLNELRETIIVKDGTIYHKETGVALEGIIITRQDDSPIVKFK